MDTNRLKRRIALLKSELAKSRQMLAASQDEELEKEANKVMKEDNKAFDWKSDDDQNERAMNNWPIEERAKVAAVLVKLAKYLSK